MKYIVVKTYDELSNKAADIIAAQILLKPNCVLGLATGSSPVGTYQRLAADNKAGKIDFSAVTTVNLDEYVGLCESDEQSYRRFMNENLFNHINIDKANTYVPNGCAADIKAEGEAYDARIKAFGGIDLQLLGIGVDGHIGFNEPDAYFTAATHEVVLDESTIEANSRFFASKEDVPTQAVTMGIGTIMKAKKIVVLASGKAKHAVIEKMLDGRITTQVPGTILKCHPDVTLICDKAAMEG